MHLTDCFLLCMQHRQHASLKFCCTRSSKMHESFSIFKRSLKFSNVYGSKMFIYIITSHKPVPTTICWGIRKLRISETVIDNYIFSDISRIHTIVNLVLRIATVSYARFCFSRILMYIFLEQLQSYSSTFSIH